MIVHTLALLSTCLLPGENGDPPQTPEKLKVYPAKVELRHRDDSQRILLLAEYKDGTTEDVTRLARLSFDGKSPVRIDEGFRLHAERDGRAVLHLHFGGKQQTLPILVRNARRRAPISFQNDVVPVLTRQGCNAGTCHGAAAGKNGFGLSLFGYDIPSDHTKLTRELRGRRINTAAPADSLLLLKPLRKIAHKGGKRLEEDTPAYHTLHRWISEGAHSDIGKAPTLKGIKVIPERAVLDGARLQQQLIVQARYSDGSSRDVTELAILSSSNEGSAKVRADGLVQSGTPGEAHIMARFGTYAEVSQVLVLDGKKAKPWPAVKSFNFIDDFVHDKLRRMRVAPGEVCDDATFLRRVYFDIINLPPTPAEARAFLADKRSDKRQRLVESLLARPEFPEVWAMQWAELLRVDSGRLERKGMHVYTNFLRKAFAENRPFDELVRDLLTAKGSNFRNPAANFYMTQRQANLMAEDAAQNFLGIRIQCAQCHNHPFEQWTMDDYYGFSAFFARVARKRGEHPYESIIYPRTGGEIRNQRTGQNAVPQYLGGEQPKIGSLQDRREVLAAWMTSKDNPWFKTSVANRVWARFFGRGIVDPADDVRVSNPPSHPELYKLLGERLAGYGFDLRKLILDICASRTYQLAPGTRELPASLYAQAPVRRLSAEQMLDGISQVTGVAERYRNLPSGARATQVGDGNPRNRFLDIFGRPRRTSACTCERRAEPTLSQALHLINGRTIDARIRSSRGRLLSMLRGKHSDAEILEELFLASYSRKPREAERSRLLAKVAKAGKKGRQAVFEDIFWALLNSKEFVFNH